MHRGQALAHCARYRPNAYVLAVAAGNALLGCGSSRDGIGQAPHTNGSAKDAGVLHDSGTNGTGTSTSVDIGSGSGAPPASTLDPGATFPQLADEPFVPDEETRWFVGSANYALNSLWAWPIAGADVHRPWPVTPEGEYWDIQQLVQSPTAGRYAFLTTAAIDKGCHMFTVTFDRSGPGLSPHCYSVPAGIDQPHALRWLDDDTLLVGLRERDHEEEEAVRWFVHQLGFASGSERITPILPDVQGVAQVAASPDGARFLVVSGWPQAPALSLLERGAEGAAVLLREGMRLPDGEDASAAVQWAPDATAVGTPDHESGQFRLFELGETPREIDLTTLPFEVPPRCLLTSDALIFVALPSGQPPRLIRYVWRSNDVQELALPDEVSGLGAITWNMGHTAVIGTATLRAPADTKSTLVRITFAPEGEQNQIVLMDNVGREVLAPLTVLADDSVLVRTRPSDNLEGIELLRWRALGGPEDTEYFGRMVTLGSDLIGYSPAKDPAELVLNLKDANGVERLVWSMNGTEQEFEPLDHAQQVEWLPDNVGVFVRSTQGLLWSDLSTGTPSRWVDVAPQ